MRRTSLGLCIAVAIGFGGQASAQPPPLQVFATGDIQAQGIVPSGDSFLVVNTNGKILSIPVSGGVATQLTNIPVPPATSCTAGSSCLSLRDGTFLPHTFGANAGKLLVVGGVAQPNTPAFASTVANNLDVTPYATQPSSLWSASVVATGFGRYTLGVLVVNQGSGQSLRNGGVNFFGPDGSVSLLAALPDAEVPYGAALVRGFGDVSNNLPSVPT